MVDTLMMLMETNAEAGEEAVSIDSQFVNISCVVTSEADQVALVAGESAHAALPLGLEFYYIVQVTWCLDSVKANLHNSVARRITTSREGGGWPRNLWAASSRHTAFACSRRSLPCSTFRRMSRNNKLVAIRIGPISD